MKNKQTSRFKPWYNCTTPATIKADPDARYIRSGSSEYAADIISRLHTLRFKHCVTHNGYIPYNDFALLPYSGRYGKGLILVTHHSPFRVKYSYYIERAERR